MADTFSGLPFGKLSQGFDFLQNLAKQANTTIPQMPNFANWVAPTLNVEELDKRLEELKMVQMWLDQNARSLQAVIQALEVQKMTLSTLHGMNFNMGDVANALKLKAADSVMGSARAAVDAAKTVSDVATGKKSAKKVVKKAAASAMVDPMQWWGALSQQFSEIANNAVKDTARKNAMDATKNTVSGIAKAAKDAAVQVTKAQRDAIESIARNVQKSPTSSPKVVKKAPAKKAAAKKAAARKPRA
jgi:hypothetical protein